MSYNNQNQNKAAQKGGNQRAYNRRTYAGDKVAQRSSTTGSTVALGGAKGQFLCSIR